MPFNQPSEMPQISQQMAASAAGGGSGALTGNAGLMGGMPIFDPQAHRLQQQVLNRFNFVESLHKFTLECAQQGIDITGLTLTPKGYSSVCIDLTNKYSGNHLRLYVGIGPITITPEGSAQMNWDRYMEDVPEEKK